MVTSFIHLFLFIYIIVMINRYKGIFISTISENINYENILKFENNDTLKQDHPLNKIFDLIVIKINRSLVSGSGSKLINQSQQTEKVVSQTLYQARLNIIAMMSWHLIVTFTFVTISVVLNIYPKDLHLQGIYALFLAASMIGIEVFWLLNAMPVTEETQSYFLHFILGKFNQTNADLTATLQTLTDNLHVFNNHFQFNSQQLGYNLNMLTKTSDSLNALATKQTEYQQLLHKLNIDEIIIRNSTFYQEVTKGMNEVSADFSQFTHLTKILNETLNKSIVLYGELNRAIERDSQFNEGLKDFNQNFKDNGHLTTQLVQLLNSTQTHLNQVVLAYAPKIEQLDEQFFTYLQKRLDSFKLALQNNDDLILQAINKRYGSIKE